ncbi:MAG: type II toxin-antitoxin system RelE/ParE family toxin [Bacteroidota bacterium]|nr:MAG: type II toxin-antitoxin system RelE/ParE family toxin [Bacteroidota bacterium]
MTVIWTLKALKSYFKVSDYLQSEWGHAVVRNFANEVEKMIQSIEANPHMFELSRKYKDIRKGFVTEHNTMFYRIKPRKKEIEILIFWDNRQDLKKRPY